MKIFKVCTIVITLGLFAISCNQDAIFYRISTEPAPLPPLIEGSPTNMVMVNWDDPENSDNKIPILYIASGKLYWHTKSADGEPRWLLPEYNIPQPEGNIISLAVARNAAGTHRLYALCLKGTSVNATLWYIDHFTDESWKKVALAGTDYPYIQSIYADPNTSQLFAGASKNNSASYAILYLDNTDDTLKMLVDTLETSKYDPDFKYKTEISMFSGVVYRGGFYYLSTRGSGIFQIPENNFKSVEPLLMLIDDDDKTLSDPEKKNRELENKSRRMFMNLIKLNDTAETIIAIERDGGALYKVNDDSFEQMEYADTTGKKDKDKIIATGRYATGALTLWQDDAIPPKKMLIAGIQGTLYNTTTSSYTNGYVEFELISSNDPLLDGSLDTNVVRRDSGKLQSVLNNDSYASNIGKHPINHLFQTPKEIDEKMTFFASTQTAGLWSYRDRPDNGGWQWNAETER